MTTDDGWHPGAPGFPRREMMSELLPCPFCGSSDIMEGVYYADGALEKRGAVRCADCGVRAPTDSWNTRFNPAATPQSPPLVRASHNSGEGDPSVMPDSGGGDTALQPQPAAPAPLATAREGLTHTRSCGYFDDETGCTCCLKERVALATEQEMHRAWRKRAEEAEAALAALAGMGRGNYEGRHSNDMILHPLSEIREWDEALQELGIQDSTQTPAEAIRELNAEIDQLRAAAQPQQADAGMRERESFDRNVAPFNLGDIVEMAKGTPYYHDWRGVQMKVVALRADPEGNFWVCVIDHNSHPPRHRGNGIYDSETTDIDARHLCSITRPERCTPKPYDAAFHENQIDQYEASNTRPEREEPSDG